MLKHFLRPLVARCGSGIRIHHIQLFSSVSHPASDQPIRDPQLEITSKFNDTEKLKILQVINGNQSIGDLLEFNISKGRAQKIRSWLSKNGHLNSIEQLLELDGFGVKNIDQFCSSIVNNEKSASRPSKSQPRNPQFTTPIVTSALRSNIQNCTAIHIGITSISWAQFQLEPDSPTSLIDWSFNTIPEQRMHIFEFIQSVREIIQRIPESDAYVFETPRVAHQGPQGTPATINISVQLSQMTAMAALAMSQRQIELNHPSSDSQQESHSPSTKKPAPVLFLRQFLASRLFHTVVGMERISTATVVGSLMQDAARVRYNQPPNRPIAGEIAISSELQRLYTSGDGPCKEYLGQSLLLGLSFLRLCILQCPHSLELLRSRVRQSH